MLLQLYQWTMRRFRSRSQAMLHAIGQEVHSFQYHLAKQWLTARRANDAFSDHRTFAPISRQFQELRSSDGLFLSPFTSITYSYSTAFPEP